jgi:hypothetical protein
MPIKIISSGISTEKKANNHHANHHSNQRSQHSHHGASADDERNGGSLSEHLRENVTSRTHLKSTRSYNSNIGSNSAAAAAAAGEKGGNYRNSTSSAAASGYHSAASVGSGSRGHREVSASCKTMQKTNQHENHLAAFIYAKLIVKKGFNGSAA